MFYQHHLVHTGVRDRNGKGVIVICEVMWEWVFEIIEGMEIKNQWNNWLAK
jgi:hypothetical protein